MWRAWRQWHERGSSPLKPLPLTRKLYTGSSISLGCLSVTLQMPPSNVSQRCRPPAGRRQRGGAARPAVAAAAPRPGRPSLQVMGGSSPGECRCPWSRATPASWGWGW